MTGKLETILILAPHTDDGELGCGGSIARWIAEGKQVHYAAFSHCESSLQAGNSGGISNNKKNKTGAGRISFTQ